MPPARYIHYGCCLTTTASPICQHVPLLLRFVLTGNPRDIVRPRSLYPCRLPDYNPMQPAVDYCDIDSPRHYVADTFTVGFPPATGRCYGRSPVFAPPPRRCPPPAVDLFAITFTASIYYTGYALLSLPLPTYTPPPVALLLLPNVTPVIDVS